MRMGKAQGLRRVGLQGKSKNLCVINTTATRDIGRRLCCMVCEFSG